MITVSSHTRRMLGRLLLSAVISFWTAGACVVISNQGLTELSYDRLLAIAVFAATGALSAVKFNSMTCSVLLPLLSLALFALGIRADIPNHLLWFGAIAILVAIGRGPAPISVYHFVCAAAASALVAVLIRWQGPRTWLIGMPISFAFYSLSRIATHVSAYIGRMSASAFADLAPVFRPALAFLFIYCAVSFAFALIYGVLFYGLPGSLRPNGHSGDINVLSLFQWTITASATAGTLELVPDRWYTRVLFILQLVSNIFLVSIYLGRFLSHGPRVVTSRKHKSEAIS